MDREQFDPADSRNRARQLWGYIGQWFGLGQEPPPAPPRGIVTEDDACRALLIAAFAVMRAVENHDGRLEAPVAGEVFEMLLVARDYIRPLPEPEPLSDGSDPIALDLRAVVDTMRTAELDAREFRNK